MSVCVDGGAEGPGGPGSVFSPCAPSWETTARIPHLQEATTFRGESVLILQQHWSSIFLFIYLSPLSFFFKLFVYRMKRGVCW